jgi:hypothetical protein
MPEQKEFLTKSEFAKLVESTVKAHQSSYMDAIIHLCEKNEIDLEESRKFISPIIKNKLEAEAMKLNFLPQTNSLPIE